MIFQRTERFKRMYKKLDSGWQNAIKRAIGLTKPRQNSPTSKVVG
jgi:hypothetical protein